MPFDQSGDTHNHDELYKEVRLAIDNTNTDKIQQLFNDYPDLDWNHVTPNGLSALWWALTPPRGEKINPDFVSFLLNLKRSDQRAINASQQYANLRPDNYIEKFIPKELCNGGLAPLISIIRDAQDNTPPDNTTNQILIRRASDRVRGLDLSGVDFRGCNLSGIDFRGFNLTNADLRLIHAKDTQWEGCNLSGALFNQFIFVEALLGSTHCTKELLAKTNNENDDALRLALGRNNNYNYHNIKAIISSPHCTAEMLKSRFVLHALAVGEWFTGMTTNERAELFKIILNSEYCTEDLLATRDGDIHPTLLHCVVYDTLHGWYDLSILQIILASRHCTDKILEIKDIHGRTPMQIAMRDHCHDNEETTKRCSEIIALFNNRKKTTDNLKKEKTPENAKNSVRHLNNVRFPFSYNPNPDYIPYYWQSTKTPELGYPQYYYYEFIDEILPNVDACFEFLASVLAAVNKPEFFDSPLNVQENDVPIRFAVKVAIALRVDGTEEEKEVYWDNKDTSDFGELDCKIDLVFLVSDLCKQFPKLLTYEKNNQTLASIAATHNRLNVVEYLNKHQLKFEIKKELPNNKLNIKTEPPTPELISSIPAIKDLINADNGKKPEEPKVNFNCVVKIRTEACDAYLKHLREAINKFTILQGSHSIASAEEKIKKVSQLKMILTSNISPADKVKNFDDSLKKDSEYLTKLLKKHRDDYLVTFLKCLGVIGAAILGLAGFGVGAFFAGKLAKEKLFSVKGEEFIEKVSMQKS